MSPCQKICFRLFLLVLTFSIVSLAQAESSNMHLSGIESNPSDDIGYKEAARQYVARQYGVQLKKLKVVGSAKVEYQSLGTTVFESKVLNVRNGEIYTIALDQDLDEINIADLDDAEQQSHNEHFGCLHPELLQHLETTTDDEQIKVILWLKDNFGAEKSYQRPSPKGNRFAPDVAAIKEAVRSERAADVEKANEPIRERIQQMGFAATADPYSPAVYAELPPAAILEAGFWDEVDTIYLDQINEPALNVARKTIFADIVHSRGINGFGSYVGVVEVGGGIPHPMTNPYLPDVVQDTDNTCLSTHSTGVVGIIKSTNSTYRGISYNANVRVGGSCIGYGSQLQSAATRAYTWGADVINNSWGGLISTMVPSANDRFFDDMVINKHVNIVAAAGNRAGPCNGDGKVLSPGLGYNTLTVGNFNDMNTSSLADDVMNSCSSYVDPASSHGDREKPEVSAPGSRIYSTTTNLPWLGSIGSGTSYSAPMVSSTIALMIDRNPSLDNWPEAVKAILMATATHNIEGARRLSDKDGAGGIVASRADYVAMNTSNAYGRWGGMAYSCSTADPYKISMSLTAGKRTRVVIVWDQNTAYGLYGSKPSADLDLKIYRGTTLIAGSYSMDNTYEIVQFTPAVTGIYTLKIDRVRCALTPKWLGWAWYRVP
ncbi:MAG: S8 family peptidase [Proteobacteria bacterium]|nr:S8 family peptidase [Pseudomonadota bacterium]